jgi:hypothetical protein
VCSWIKENILDEVIDIETDIYDLSWYTLYELEVKGRLLVRNNIDRIYSYLRTLSGMDDNLLRISLYNKEIAIGALLGYYVLLKSRFYDKEHLQKGLLRVLKIVKNYIDEYALKGEVLYTLKMLDNITGAIKREIGDINSKITELFSELRKTFLRGNPRVEEAEDLSYAIWAICESKLCTSIDQQDLLKTILDDRLYDLVTMDYISAAIYASALSSFVLNCGRSRTKDRDYMIAIYKRVKELVKMLKHVDDKEIGYAQIGKLKLGAYNSERALQKLKTLGKVQQLRKKCERREGILFIMIGALLLIIIQFPSLLLPIASLLAPYSNFAIIITIILIDEGIGRILSERRVLIRHWISEGLRLILRSLGQMLH